MPGTGTLTSSPGYPGGSAAQIVVSKYDPTQDTNFFTVVPNVECLAIQKTEGANPGVARFRYRMGDPLNPQWPDRIEDIYGLNVVSSPYVLAIDQRIVVTKIDPPIQGSDDVQYTILFDGRCLVPQQDASGGAEMVTFQALGIAAQCWDRPVGGAMFRSGPDLTKDDGSADDKTDRPTRFNPTGSDGSPQPNMIVQPYWSTLPPGPEDPDGEPPQLYPVFLDAPEDGLRDVTKFDFWTLSSAVSYLLARYNPSEKYVTNPSFQALTVLLDSFEVVPGMEFDPLDDSTYTEDPITVQDYDATGDPWPVAIEKLITPYGFGFRFRLGQDSDGKPQTTMQFYRTDAANAKAPKWVYLATAGSAYDPSSTNATAASTSRDVAGVFNEVILDTELVRYEVSLCLVPGPYMIQQADAANVENFTIGNPAYTGANVDAYRVFIFDEDGVGHWNSQTRMVVTGDATPMNSIFGSPTKNARGELVYTYAARPRKPLGTLFSRRIVDGDRLRAQLHVSNNPKFIGSPYVYTDGGDWQRVADGTWELLPNRLGVRFTVDNPDKLNIGPPPQGQPNVVGNGGILHLVQAFALPPGTVQNQQPIPTFRLTCVIEADQNMQIRAKRRVSSTSPRTIVRRFDTRDRFVKHIIDSSSIFNTDPDDKAVADQDDTDAAQAYADALREAHDTAPLDGTIKIPRLTLSYHIGDPIQGIYGRNVSFRVNQGAPVGEAAQYPVISSIDYEFGDGESTTLHLTTRQHEPPPERRR